MKAITKASAKSNVKVRAKANTKGTVKAIAKRNAKGNVKTNGLVIGLDYGTTHTGVSFCESSSTAIRDESIEIVHDWPSEGKNNVTQEKVPSVVAYGDAGIVWGSLVPPDMPRHVWTKLQLDSQHVEKAAKIFREIATSSQDADKQPDDVITDFLTQVKAHLITNLDKRYGEDVWRTLPITLVVTFPAVWSDQAKARTLEAVDKAGFNSFEFPQTVTRIVATEPEAAAIYTITNFRGTTQNKRFSVGDGFIVCDMGGGTVDLVSYRVTKTQPIMIEEATVGSGDQCGGSSVDRAYFRLLERRLGTADFIQMAGCTSDKIGHTSLTKSAHSALQHFISKAKGVFSGTQSYVLDLPYPLSKIDEDEARGINFGEIHISTEEMIELFEKSIRSTLMLISEQLSRASQVKRLKMKYIFMVGGFSESPYMFNRIKKFAGNLGLTAIQPSHPWSAVARGATLKGLGAGSAKPDMVENRKCRRHYGTPCNQVFDSTRHLESDSFICEYSGRKKARKQASWLVEKGQSLSTTKTSHATLPFNSNFWPWSDKTNKIKLIAAEIDEAPRCTYEDGVKTVATLLVDLAKVPEEEFKPFTSPSGGTYNKLTYDIEISIQATLTFSVLVNGKTYGSVSVKYE